MNNDVQIHFNQNIVNKMILKRLKTIQELIENKEENMSKKQCNPAPPLSVPDISSPPPPPPTRKISEKFNPFNPEDTLVKMNNKNMEYKNKINYLENELNIASDTIKELRRTQNEGWKNIQTLEEENTVLHQKLDKANKLVISQTHILNEKVMLWHSEKEEKKRIWKENQNLKNKIKQLEEEEKEEEINWKDPDEYEKEQHKAEILCLKAKLYDLIEHKPQS